MEPLKKKTRPGRTKDAGKTSPKGPLGVMRPLESRQGSTVGRLDAIPRNLGHKRVRKRQGGRAWCPKGG